VIPHGDADRAALRDVHGVDLDRATGPVLEGVVDEILQDLLHLDPIGDEHGQLRGAVPGEASGPGRSRDRPVRQGLEERDGVHLLAPDGQATALEARDVERGGDEAVASILDGAERRRRPSRAGWSSRGRDGRPALPGMFRRRTAQAEALETTLAG